MVIIGLDPPPPAGCGVSKHGWGGGGGSICKWFPDKGRRGKVRTYMRRGGMDQADEIQS